MTCVELAVGRRSGCRLWVSRGSTVVPDCTMDVLCALAGSWGSACPRPALSPTTPFSYFILCIYNNELLALERRS